MHDILKATISQKYQLIQERKNVTKAIKALHSLRDSAILSDDKDTDIKHITNQIIDKCEYRKIINRNIAKINVTETDIIFERGEFDLSQLSIFDQKDDF